MFNKKFEQLYAKNLNTVCNVLSNQLSITEYKSLFNTIHVVNICYTLEKEKLLCFKHNLTAKSFIGIRCNNYHEKRFKLSENLTSPLIREDCCNKIFITHIAEFFIKFVDAPIPDFTDKIQILNILREYFCDSDLSKIEKIIFEYDLNLISDICYAIEDNCFSSEKPHSTDFNIDNFSSKLHQHMHNSIEEKESIRKIIMDISNRKDGLIGIDNTNNQKESLVEKEKRRNLIERIDCVLSEALDFLGN